MSRRLWHGGAPGRAVGELLLPPSRTGLVLTRADESVASGLDQISQRRDRVYVTSDRELAKVFARQWSDGRRMRSHGWLYEVSAETTDLEDDADIRSLPGVSFQASEARVAAIIDRGVRPDYAASRRTLTRVLDAHARARS